jgi:hypothetical protein
MCVAGERVFGSEQWLPVRMWTVRWRRAVCTNLRIDQPVWSSTNRDTASAANNGGSSSIVAEDVPGSSGRGACGQGPATQAQVLEGRRLVGLVEGTDVGTGRDDLVDAVEHVVGEGDVQAGK